MEHSYHTSTRDSDEECTQLAKAAIVACNISNDKLGVTDLCEWAGGRNTELSRLLVDAGADIAVKYSTGKTALHVAAGLRDGKIVRKSKRTISAILTSTSNW